MTTIYDKSFNLNNSSGPNNSGLRILSVTKSIESTDIILLQLSEMVMYPVKSYGKTKRTYMIYIGDRNTGKSDYYKTFATKADALRAIRNC